MFQPRATPKAIGLLYTLLTILIIATTGYSQIKTKADAEKLVSNLKWKDGNISLGNGIASVNLQNGYRFLDTADSTKVLSDLWGNPPQTTMGMIFPSGTGPLDETWAVVIDGFEEEGYVKDNDAEKLDADKLLKQLKEGQQQANEARREKGYAELELVGWAVPPHYDKEAKKLYWAIDIKRVGGTRHSVNYYVRILGRRGYLVINTIGSLEQVKEIEAATPDVLKMIEFQQGHRYTDFNPKTDKVAAYGLAGLILGAVGLKLAAKVGLLALILKKFGIILLALKKLWILIIAAIAGLFKKLKGVFVKEKPTPVPLATDSTSVTPQLQSETTSSESQPIQPPDHSV